MLPTGFTTTAVPVQNTSSAASSSSTSTGRSSTCTKSHVIHTILNRNKIMQPEVTPISFCFYWRRTAVWKMPTPTTYKQLPLNFSDQKLSLSPDLSPCITSALTTVLPSCATLNRCRRFITKKDKGDTS